MTILKNTDLLNAYFAQPGAYKRLSKREKQIMTIAFRQGWEARDVEAKHELEIARREFHPVQVGAFITGHKFDPSRENDSLCLVCQCMKERHTRK